MHDTLEDRSTSAEEPASLFGPKVLAVVQEVTDDKSLPKLERKRMQIEHAAHISSMAKLGKLADKICNIIYLLNSPPADWPFERKQETLLWTEQVVERLRGTNAALEGKYDELLQTGKIFLEIT